MCSNSFCWKRKWKTAQWSEWLSCRSLIQSHPDLDQKAVTNDSWRLFYPAERARWLGFVLHPEASGAINIRGRELINFLLLSCDNQSFPAEAVCRIRVVLCCLFFQLWNIQYSCCFQQGYEEQQWTLLFLKISGLNRTIWPLSPAAKINLHLTVYFTSPKYVIFFQGCLNCLCSGAKWNIQPEVSNKESDW